MMNGTKPPLAELSKLMQCVVSFVARWRQSALRVEPPSMLSLVASCLWPGRVFLQVELL
jgi:hypothetical protein